MKFFCQAAVVLLCGTLIACKGKHPPVAAHDPTHGVSSSSLATLDGFEGEVGLTFKGTFGGVSAPATGTNVSALVKLGRVRVPLPDLLPVTAALGMAYLIVVPEMKAFYAVSDNKLQATLVDLDALLAYPQTQAGYRPLLPNAATESGPYKSGHADSVAGYACERWDIQLEAVSVDLCVAKLATPWLRVPLTGAASKHSWAVELTDGNHFPLRLITRLGGAEQGRLEVTSIQKKAIQASTLQVPSNYGVVTLAEMLASFTVHTRAPSSSAH
jgi:hypothetical protein